MLTLAAGVAAALASLAAATPTTAASVSIHGGDFYFCDPSFRSQVCTTTVQQNDTVVWDFAGEVHTTTACGASCDTPASQPLWDSGFIEAGSGGTFSFTFNAPGAYLYFCRVHNIDMRGQIIVEAAAATPVPAGQPTSQPAGDASTPVPQGSGSTGSLPVAGAGPQPSEALLWWPAVTLTASGLVLLGGAVVYRRSIR
ncbi:MAG: plastocyanin/azurin family copper-binding protein [Dehalococcoidia bacterium]